MRLKKFRITNFRSIVDTGWCPFSPDGVTVLVGQNESGKSSILEALATSFGLEKISDDDLRTDAPLPKTYRDTLVSMHDIAKPIRPLPCAQFARGRVRVGGEYRAPPLAPIPTFCFATSMPLPRKRRKEPICGTLSISRNFRVSVLARTLHKNPPPSFWHNVELKSHRVRTASAVYPTH